MEIQYELTLADYKEAQAAHPLPVARWRQIVIMAILAGLAGWDFAQLWLRQIQLPATLRALIAAFAPVIPWFLVVFISLLLSKSSAPPNRRRFDVRSQKTIFDRLRNWIVFLSFILAAAPWIFRQAIQFFRGGDTGNYTLSLFFIWLAIVLLLRFVVAPRARRKLWARQPNVARPKRLQYSSESVTETSDLSSTTYKWAAFLRCVETPNLFMLYPSGITFHMVPKRAFSSPQAIDEFRQLIHEWADGQSVGFPVIQAAQQSS